MQLGTAPDSAADSSKVIGEAPPDPVSQTFHSLALARSLGVAARLGILAELAQKPVDPLELAQQFGLQAEPLRMMLDVLVNADLVQYRDSGYVMNPLVRRWLDPEAPTSVTGFMSYSLEYWSWWEHLESVVRGGPPPNTRPAPDDEAGWLRRVRGDYELARRIGDDAADAIDLPSFARSIVDIGSGHGWHAATLCKRNAMLHATVIDQEPAVAIGREIIWEAGLDRRVVHQAGDIYSADLGGPHDAAICLPLMHGLPRDRTIALLTRIRSVLQPGGLLIFMRPWTMSQPERRNASSGPFELYFRLVTGIDPSSATQLRDQLAAAGFGVSRAHQLPSALELAVHVARAI